MRKQATRIKVSEHMLQTQIINYLRYKGWYCMRLNTGKFSVGEGRQKRFIMGQEAGTPDIVAFRKIFMPVSPVHMLEAKQLQLIFVEVKVPGNKPTLLQREKMKELEEYGAVCIVAHGIEDLENYGI